MRAFSLSLLNNIISDNVIIKETGRLVLKKKPNLKILNIFLDPETQALNSLTIQLIALFIKNN